MRNKYLASGMCSVLSCDIMLADLLGSANMRLTKVGDEDVESVVAIRVYHGDFTQIACVSFLISVLNVCLVADLLSGRVVVSMSGSH